jgi:hypothetical protein
MKKKSFISCVVLVATIMSVESKELNYLSSNIQDPLFFETEQTDLPHRRAPELSNNTSGTERGLEVTGEYLYNASGVLIEKTNYEIDEFGRVVEKSVYILNDNSKNWMYSREMWILSYYHKRVYDPTDNNKNSTRLIFYESKSLDLNSGILKGVTKYSQTFSDIELFNSSYELYIWNNTTNDWKGASKYERKNSLINDTVNVDEVRFSWNDTTKTWNMLNNQKYSFKYKKVGKSIFFLESKNFELKDGKFIVVSEVKSKPNYANNDTFSTENKKIVDGNLVFDSKTESSFNNNNRITQKKDYKWYNNQWVLITQNNYDYSFPDSIRTNITYNTSDYYLLSNMALPQLCNQETMYPIQKRITKNHLITNALELNYAYSWSNCNWIPTLSKTTYVFDESGKYKLSQTTCSNRNSTDWTGCSVFKYLYNSKWKNTSMTFTSYNLTGTYKTETNYLSDTIIISTSKYSYIDRNLNSFIEDDEWVLDNIRYYKYKLAEGDSAHIESFDNNYLKIFDLNKLKKIKISGQINCTDLYEINKLSRDSLKLLDLSDALLQNDYLSEDCIGNTQLETLILPKSLKTIDQDAIESEIYLRNLVIYPSIEYIADNALNTIGIENLTIPTKYFNKLFSFDKISQIPGIRDVYKSTLKTITFNDISGTIPDNLCYNLNYLQKVIIGNGITEIGNNAFKSCGMLKEIQFPENSLRNIGYNAFWGCNELTEIKLPEGLQSINQSAFWGCSGVTSITMPSSLTNIAQNAFWGCSNVKNMKVNALSPPALENNALYGIPRNAKLNVPETGFNSYKQALQWKEFYNMETGTVDLNLKELLIIVENNQLIIQKLPLNTHLRVYDISGVKLFEKQSKNVNESFELNKGLYLLSIDEKIIKVIIQ